MKLKQMVFTSIFFLFALPFVFINNFYPSFRFGMFAEPAGKKTLKEEFSVYIVNAQNQQTSFDPSSVGFDKGQFAYMLRDSFYQQKIQQVLRQLYQNLKNNYQIKQLKFVRILKRTEQMQTDTTHTLYWPDEKE